MDDINNLRYEPKLIYEPKKIIINQNSYIEIQLLEIAKRRFYDVSLINGIRKIFIGRYTNLNNYVGAKYKNGKILIYLDSFIQEKKGMEITEVLSLYEIADDTFYYCTEEEALLLFDPNLNSQYLKNKNKSVIQENNCIKIKKH